MPFGTWHLLSLYLKFVKEKEYKITIRARARAHANLYIRDSRDKSTSDYTWHVLAPATRR